MLRVGISVRFNKISFRRVRIDACIRIRNKHTVVQFKPADLMSIENPSSKNDLVEPFEFVDFDEIASVACPCGQAKRAFTDTQDFPGTVHVTEISLEAKAHYHREHSEVYYFLECDENAKMELNGELISVKSGQSIFIRPNTMHRAIGKMKVLIVSMPKFDPLDEHFAE